jgi:hypothetical protein
MELSKRSQEQLARAMPQNLYASRSAPKKKPLPSEIGRFPGEDLNGPVDVWLRDAVIPPPTPGPIKVCLIVLWAGKLPGYVEYFARSASFSAKHGLARVIHGFFVSFRRSGRACLLHRWTGATVPA